MEVTELTCPNCCAPLKLNKASGLATCDYCESTFLYNKTKPAEKKQPSTVASESYNDHKPSQTISYNTGTAGDGSEVIWGPITKKNIALWVVFFVLCAPIAVLVLVWRSDLPKAAKIGVTTVVVLLMMFAAIAD